MNEDRLNYLLAYLRELRQMPSHLIYFTEPNIDLALTAINKELDLKEGTDSKDDRDLN